MTTFKIYFLSNFQICSTVVFLTLNFLKINLFYLFIFGCVGSSLLHAGFLQLWRAGATLCCCTRASHCGGLSCCGAPAPGALQQVQHVGSVVVAHGLQSTVSVVVAHRLSCSAACGIFPDQGCNLCPLRWQADSQPLHPQGSPQYSTVNCSHHAVYYIPLTYLFYNWKFIPFDFLHSFPTSPHPTSDDHQSISVSASLVVTFFFSFLDSTCK